MLVINQKRMLLRRATVRDDFNLRPRHGGFDARFDFVESFHGLSSSAGILAVGPAGFQPAEEIDQAARLVAPQTASPCYVHVRSISGGLNTSRFAGGSRSCLPNFGTGNSLGCSGFKNSALSTPVNFCSSILRCNSMNACKSASGRGGQPGM